jgi:hypothetical protein
LVVLKVEAMTTAVKEIRRGLSAIFEKRKGGD